jgi:hypothetical protein
MSGKSRKPLPLSDEGEDAVLLERVEALASREGLPSLTPKGELPKTAVPRPLKPLKLMVPDYLFRELTVRAAESSVTKKYLILKALQDAGFTVESEDLEEDGRRLR